MKFTNGTVLDERFCFVQKDFYVRNGIFSWTGGEEEPETDLSGLLVIPGLIDLHIHGCAGVDFCGEDEDALARMAAFLWQNGITSFAPATMTLPPETLFRVIRAAARSRNTGGAKLAGIHLEGPFFSKEKRGAQDPRYLQNPDLSLLSELTSAGEGLVKLVSVAPELLGGMDFIREASRFCRISLGHTQADYETARAAFSAGATHVTHLFNGMPPFLHRAPGVVGAAAENQAVRAELICDGIHVHESAVRVAFKLFGAERIVLISDALSPCGAGEGEYRCGELPVYLRGGASVLADGTLAGSAQTLFDGVRNAIRFGIKPEDAIRAASENPAKELQIDKETGSLKEGKRADFVVCSRNFELRAAYVDGERNPRETAVKMAGMA